MLISGIEIEHRDTEGSMRGDQARVVDFDSPASNDWPAVNQFTVTEDPSTRPPEVVLFVSGLPLGIIELRNPVAAYRRGALELGHDAALTVEHAWAATLPDPILSAMVRPGAT